MHEKQATVNAARDHRFLDAGMQQGLAEDRGPGRVLVPLEIGVVPQQYVCCKTAPKLQFHESAVYVA